MSIVGIFAVCRVSVKEREKPIVQKNECAYYVEMQAESDLTKISNNNTSNVYFFLHFEWTLRFEVDSDQLDQFVMNTIPNQRGFHEIKKLHSEDF